MLDSEPELIETRALKTRSEENFEDKMSKNRKGLHSSDSFAVKAQQGEEGYLKKEKLLLPQQEHCIVVFGLKLLIVPRQASVYRHKSTEMNKKNMPEKQRLNITSKFRKVFFCPRGTSFFYFINFCWVKDRDWCKKTLNKCFFK